MRIVKMGVALTGVVTVGPFVAIGGIFALGVYCAFLACCAAIDSYQSGRMTSHLTAVPL